jgi:hypothetical protein
MRLQVGLSTDPKLTMGRTYKDDDKMPLPYQFVMFIFKFVAKNISLVFKSTVSEYEVLTGSEYVNSLFLVFKFQVFWVVTL